MSSEKNVPTVTKITTLEKDIINLPILYQEMQKELAKTRDFAERLEIILDTVENLFRIKNNQPLLSYSQYRKLRKNKYKNIKNYKKNKKLKRWKKIKQQL